jgi:hypothetical protein
MHEENYCQKLINYERYPIDDIDNPKRQEIINHIRQELDDDGCAVVKNFLSDYGLNTIKEEATMRVDQTYYSPKKLCNVYLGEGDDSLPDDHPRNVMLPRTNGFITADLLEDTACHQLYYWAPLCRFLADCLGKEELHIYADPISNMIVNVAEKDQQFNWHFDTNEFTITMLLQSAEEGGYFEYAPNLRNSQDECYDDVKDVLNGNHDKVKRLNLEEGDLQFFKGRYSLHQVTKNEKERLRLLLIMSFTEQAGVIGNMVRVKDLYGKVSDVHMQQEKAQSRTRSDQLLD